MRGADAGPALHIVAWLTSFWSQFFEQGLIEEDEFNEQKAVLLDRIMNKPVRASTAQPAASRQTQATPPRESQQACRLVSSRTRVGTDAAHPSPARRRHASRSRCVRHHHCNTNR